MEASQCWFLSVRPAAAGKAVGDSANWLSIRRFQGSCEGCLLSAEAVTRYQPC